MDVIQHFPHQTDTYRDIITSVQNYVVNHVAFVFGVI